MVNRTDFDTAIAEMEVFARNPADPDYVRKPTASSIESGAEPLETLPAQYWNWFLKQFTTNFNTIKEYAGNAIGELDGILDFMGISPDGTTANQLKGIFQTNYLENYLPKKVSDSTALSVNASHNYTIPVSDDDGNSAYGLKNVPYSPQVIVCTTAKGTQKTVTLPNNCPFVGMALKVVFLAGHDAASISTNMTLNNIVVCANKNGTITPLPIYEITTGVYSVLQPNTVLDLYYTADGYNGGPAWIVVGNPVVLSGSNYTYYADGSSVVDAVADNNMNAVTSNAVYNQLLNKYTIEYKENVDLNTLTDNGLYRLVSSDRLAKNFPVDSNGVLMVNTPSSISGAWLQQTFFSDSASEVYTRNYTQAWSPWVKLLNTSDKVDFVAANDLRCVTSNAVFDKFNSRVERFEHGEFTLLSDGYDHRVNFNPPFPDDDHLIISVMRTGADNWSTQVTYFVTSVDRTGFGVHTNGPSNVYQAFHWYAYYSKEQ